MNSAETSKELRKEQWGKFCVTDNLAEKEKVLMQILKTAESRGEILKVYKIAPAGGEAEAAALEIITGFNKQDPFPIS